MNSLFQTLYKQLESWCFRILLEEYCLLGILLCKNHCKAKQRILLTKQTSSTRVRIAASSYNLRMGPSEQIHRVIRRDLLLFQVPPDPKWTLSIFFSLWSIRINADGIWKGFSPAMFNTWEPAKFFLDECRRVYVNCVRHLRACTKAKVFVQLKRDNERHTLTLGARNDVLLFYNDRDCRTQQDVRNFYKFPR